MREIVLDTETTGFEPRDGHRIVEIGCVELFNHLPTGNVYHSYINPQRDMPEAAFKVHGLSEDFLKNHNPFESHAKEFIDFLGDSPLIIHNAKFDMKFINFEICRIGYKKIPMERCIDTLLIARNKFPGSPANLDALCRRFEIDLSDRTSHGALLDSRLLAKVYLELIGGRQRILKLRNEINNNDENTVNCNEDSFSIKSIRNFDIFDEELSNHIKYISENIKNPIWEKFNYSKLN